jgi:uncharacterized protein YdhG (YjbR/CyaY superfamily)
MKKFKDIDTYIMEQSKEAQVLLRQIRKTIKKAAPDATEKISYGIPTFFLNRNLVHFGAFSDHISFFPTSSGITTFKKELHQYKIAKGTVQFSLNAKLPLSLIAKIVKFRVKENKKKKK